MDRANDPATDTLAVASIGGPMNSMQQRPWLLE
jgi:hypothetical protein